MSWLGVKVEAANPASRDPLGQLTPREVTRAALVAVNHTAKQVSVLASRLVAKEAGLKTGKVREQFRVHQARPSHLQATVRATGDPFSLFHFSARQVRRGTTARAWGQRKLYPKTFIARVRSGEAGEHRAVWVRMTRKRFPIRKLYGPGVPDTLARQEISSTVEAHAATRLETNMVRQIDRALRKKAGLAG